MIVIDRKAERTMELAWLVAILAELGHERAIIIIIITREYLHSMISTSDEQETSMMVECQACWRAELAISIALLLGADRELDSSITIKSIVSHLFLFNLSHNDKEMIQAPNCSNQRDEDLKPSHTRDTRHETRDTKQASKQRATRSNKNQSMKEQRTAPPSTNHSLTHTSLFLIIFIIILESSSLGLGVGIGICIGKRS